MIDTHCHLDLYPSPARVIKEIDRRGVYVLAVTTTPNRLLKKSARRNGFPSGWSAAFGFGLVEAMSVGA